MDYRVRSEGGEVKFKSLYEIQRAVSQGLVSPDDEMTDGDQGTWRKVKEVPALSDARPPPTGFFQTTTGRWVLPLCALSALTLGLLFSERYRVAGLGLAIFVGLLLSQFTFKVFSKKQVR